MWCGVVRCGVVWCGEVWCGVALCTVYIGTSLTLTCSCLRLCIKMVAEAREEDR